MTSVYPLLAQASRDPLPPADVAEIFEDVKDMGVLIGKGGVYGQVGRRGAGAKPLLAIYLSRTQKRSTHLLTSSFFVATAPACLHSLVC